MTDHIKSVADALRGSIADHEANRGTDPNDPGKYWFHHGMSRGLTEALTGMEWAIEQDRRSMSEDAVRSAEEVLCDVAGERSFTLSDEARQMMLSTAHNLSWLLRQADFQEYLRREEKS